MWVFIHLHTYVLHKYFVYAKCVYPYIIINTDTNHVSSTANLPGFCTMNMTALSTADLLGGCCFFNYLQKCGVYHATYKNLVQLMGKVKSFQSVLLCM